MSDSNPAKKFYSILILLAIGGWILVFVNHYYLVEKNNDDVSFCLIRSVTGYPCPSCGVGRGIDHLLEGNLNGAFMLNPLSFIVLFAGIVIPLWITADYFNKKATLFLVNKKMGSWLKRNPIVVIAFVILILGNWAWNLIKF